MKVKDGILEEVICNVEGQKVVLLTSDEDKIIQITQSNEVGEEETISLSWEHASNLAHYIFTHLFQFDENKPWAETDLGKYKSKKLN